MSAISISKNAQAALEIAQWVRNSKAPVAELQNRLATMCGYAAHVTETCVFTMTSDLVGTGGTSQIPDSLATRSRWRFPYHSTPYASFIYARFEIAPQNNGTATDPYCQLAIRNLAGTLIGTAYMHGGSSPGSYADVPINMTGGTAHLVDGTGAFVFLDEDTWYTGVFSDIGFARLHSASVWEVSMAPSTANGFVVNNHASDGPIYAQDRDDIAAMARLLHKRSGRPVFHWCTDLDSEAPAMAAAANEAQSAMTLGAVTVAAVAEAGRSATASMTLAALTISSTATVAGFDTVLTSIADSFPTWSNTVPLTFYVDAIASGVAQTNGVIHVSVTDNHEMDLVGSIATNALNGWTESGWVLTGQVWTNEYTRAAVAVGTTRLDVEIQFSSRAGLLYIDVTRADTTQATDATLGSLTISIVN